MRGHTTVVLVLVMFVVASLASPAFAAVTVQIGGNTVASPAACPPPTGSNEVIVSNCDGSARQPFTNACFTIAGVTGGTPAKIRADDQTIDRIFLDNALIKSTSANCISDVQFFETFAAGPKATAVKVTFTRSTKGIGSLMRPSTGQGAIGSYFKVTGWINDNGTGDNEIATYQQKTVVAATDYQFDFSKQEDWNFVSLQANRVMKARFWFKLYQAQDELRLPNGVAIESTAGGGEGGRNDHSIANDPSITTGDEENEKCAKKHCPHEGKDAGGMKSMKN